MDFTDTKIAKYWFLLVLTYNLICKRKVTQVFHYNAASLNFCFRFHSFPTSWQWNFKGRRKGRADQVYQWTTTFNNFFTGSISSLFSLWRSIQTTWWGLQNKINGCIRLCSFTTAQCFLFHINSSVIQGCNLLMIILIFFFFWSLCSTCKLEKEWSFPPGLKSYICMSDFLLLFLREASFSNGVQ